jgi:uncharacterized protein (TIGR03083 family)
MITTATPATLPRRSALPREAAMRLAATEYARFSTVVAELQPADWALPTDCPDWNVQQLVGHVVGMARLVASPLEQLRQQRAAGARRPAGTPMVDSLTAVQVDRFASLGPEGLVRLMERTGPRAAKGRRRIPRFLRNRPMAELELVGGQPEEWTLGYLLETILTRDTWMHRVDVARATGRPMRLTADHDGVIVADVVAEWAGRHGRPYRLTLTGPAGGSWSQGADGEPLDLDAVEFCRLVSGRGAADGLLSVQVPF